MQTNTGERSWVGPVGAVAVLGLAHLLGVATSLEAPERLRLVHDAAGWVGSIVGVLGAVAAAGAFSRGDYLRRVWTLFAAASVLLLVGTALRSYWMHTAPERSFLESPLLAPRMVVVVAANAVSTWALVLLVRTYRRSGLQPPASAQLSALWGVGGLVALGLAAHQFHLDLARFGQGTAHALSAVTSMGSTLGDFITILLIVPILRVAYMLRGGRLAWVWWVMGLSGAVWLLYDVREWLSVALPGDAASNLELLRVLRSMGLALVGLSGWLQRAALAASPVATPRGALDVPPGAA